ncbi:opsin-5-like [Diadema antillarum]|uniref:opsin-5-like n=1 Tax=Diadema antillarum TaxID=105358 RepID=UPI003A849261
MGPTSETNGQGNDSRGEDSYHSSLSASGDIFAGLYLLLVIIISIVGNTAVVVISVRKRSKLKPLDFLTINLAITDLVVAVTGYPLAMVSSFKHEWYFGDAGCMWYGFAGFLFGVVSMGTLSTIAIFRYIKLCRENVDQYNSRKCVLRAVLAIWVIAIIITTPPLMGWSRYVLEPYKVSCTVDFADTSAAGLAYTYVIVILAFALPFGIIVVCYAAIARRMIAHNRRINVRNNIVLEVRLIKTACAITVAFILTWTPYTIIALWASFEQVQSIPDSFVIIPAFFAKTSSIYSPIIYYIFNKNFRNEVSSFLCCCACQCYTVTINLELNSHAQRRLLIVESLRKRRGLTQARPQITWTKPFPWKFSINGDLEWRRRRQQTNPVTTRPHTRVENINIAFNQRRERVDMNITTDDIGCDGVDSMRPENLARVGLENLDEISPDIITSGRPDVTQTKPQCVAGCSIGHTSHGGDILRGATSSRSRLSVTSAKELSLASAIHLPGTADHRRTIQGIADLHVEALNPSTASGSVRIILVEPNIGRDLSSDSEA